MATFITLNNAKTSKPVHINMDMVKSLAQRDKHPGTLCHFADGEQVS